jgi:hypothetical protein
MKPAGCFTKAERLHAFVRRLLNNMRNILRGATATIGFLILAGAAIAQAPDWYQHREERFRGDQWRNRMFSEVREDLDHIQSKTFPIGRDEYRIVRTKQELDELQNDFNAHRYNEGKVDDVVNALQKVVADNRMSSRDRDVLNEDLQHLRNFRAHHEEWWHGEGRH